jgi:hypothetical protein
MQKVRARKKKVRKSGFVGVAPPGLTGQTALGGLTPARREQEASGTHLPNIDIQPEGIGSANRIHELDR